LTYAIRLEFGSSQERKTSMFSSQMDTGRRERWELESRLAKETFFRARFEAKQKPISRPCPSLACLLSSSLFSYGGGALRCTAAATSRQFSSKKSSLSIYFIDNISIRQAVGTEGVQVGHPTPPPPPDFVSCTSKTFSFQKRCLLFSPSDS
jgi:hypothetical protein